jgi:hypothetical protein
MSTGCLPQWHSLPCPEQLPNGIHLNTPHTLCYVEFSLENVKGKSHMGDSGEQEMTLTHPLPIPSTDDHASADPVKRRAVIAV